MFLRKSKSLEKLLDLKEKDVVVAVGSNGKTTFCLNLCEELKKRGKTVIFSTTVKIFPVNEEYGFVDMTYSPGIKTETRKRKMNLLEKENDIFLLNREKKLDDRGNVYVLGIYDRKIGKITSLPEEILKKFSEKCDYAVIEGDGSKSKPLKGWGEREPVYIVNTTKSVGIIPINIIGERIDDRNIHRMEKFLKISKGKEGEILKLEHLYNIIIHKNGLFQYSLGEKILILNCTETKKDRENVLKLAKMIKNNVGFKNVKVSAASLKERKYYKIEEGVSKQEENQNNPDSKISAVIMASGKSERMGENKLLLEYKGMTFIENILEKVINEKFYEVAIVVSDRKVKKKCQDFIEKFNEINNSETAERSIYIVENREPEKGQSESIKLGLKILRKCSGYMFFSGDQPFLSKDTIKKVMRNFKEGMITVPEYNGKKGLPTIFGKNFKNELLELEGDTGGKPVIERNKDKIKIVKIENPYEGRDIDTKEDYEMIKKGEQYVYSGNNNK